MIPGPALAFATDLSGQPNVSGVPWPDLSSVVNLNGQFEAQGFAFDVAQQSTSVLDFTIQAYPELAQVLAEDPNFLQDLSPGELEELSFTFYIEAAATPMTAAEYVTYQTNLADKIRTAILADSNAPAMLKLAAANQTDWEDGYLQALENTGQLRPADMPPAALAVPAISSLMSTIGAGILAGPAGQSIIAANNLDSFFSEVLTWYGNTPGATGSTALPSESTFDLQLSHPTHFEAFKITVGQPLDASVAAPPTSSLADFFGLTAAASQSITMTGPSGYGGDNFVPANAPLPYSIQFMSPVGGQGPESQIQIVDQLDPNLDLRTFQLSDIDLDGVTIQLPSNRASFTGSFDLTKQLGFILNVTAGVDVDSGIATWLLTAIDPSTGLPVATPALSIMPAGQSGAIGYTIEAQSTATTGTTIDAAARIIYDSQQPLDSNAVSATLDAVPPTTTYSVTDLGNSQYFIQWQATDDPGGSGVANSTVYVSLDDGVWQPVDQYTTANSFTCRAPPASPRSSSCSARTTRATSRPRRPETSCRPTIRRSISARCRPQQRRRRRRRRRPRRHSPRPIRCSCRPSRECRPPRRRSIRRHSARCSSRSRRAALVTGFATSGADISPLGIAFSPNGQSVYVSGGAGATACGSSRSPAAARRPRRLWRRFPSRSTTWPSTAAASSGPPRAADPCCNSTRTPVRSSPVSARASSWEWPPRVQRTRAIPTISMWPRATAFRSSTRSRTSSSPSPARASTPWRCTDGTLWGTTWPYGGQIVRFDSHGNATPAVDLSDPANGLAFGQPNTPLANLLFATHVDGTVSMIDLVTGQSITVASGGQRGDFAHVGVDGRLYITQSDQIDVFTPILPPQIVATNPADDASVAPNLDTAEVTFDGAMLADTSVGSVTDTANYVLTDTTTGQQVPVSAVTYDPSGQTAELLFDPLLPGSYSLNVEPQVENIYGLALGSVYETSFIVTANGGSLLPTISNTRLNRELGEVFFDLSVENTLTFPVNAPLQVIFTNLPATGDTLLDADGFTIDGHPFIELSAAGNQLASDQSTETRTLSLPANALYSSLGIEDLVLSGVVIVPAVSSIPPPTATVGQLYQYNASATDSSGANVTYALVEAPTGATVNPQTGVVQWTPQLSDRLDREFRAQGLRSDGRFLQPDLDGRRDRHQSAARHQPHRRSDNCGRTVVADPDRRHFTLGEPASDLGRQRAARRDLRSAKRDADLADRLQFGRCLFQRPDLCDRRHHHVLPELPDHGHERDCSATIGHAAAPRG